MPRELTGKVQGQDATDIEEYFCTALDKHEIEYQFQVSYVAGKNILGEIRLDVLAFYGVYMPFGLDGEYAHKDESQKAEDLLKDNLLNEILKGAGALPVVRIPGDEIDSWEKADSMVKEIFYV